MVRKILRLIRRFQIKINFTRLRFDVVLQNKIPHVKVNEKHEKLIKWVVRSITIIGIISSVIAFSTWYYSLFFSIILFLIEQIVEQIIFTHFVMLVQPLPESWDASKWTSMIIRTNGRETFLGFGFSDPLVGKEFLNLLFAWNDNCTQNDRNIQLTFVQENERNYSVHIYPTDQRTFVIENIKFFERDFDKRENAGKELNVLLMQICFCKVFPMSRNCAYNYLMTNSQNIHIQIIDTSRIQEDDPSTYSDITVMDQRTILFTNITVCKRSELDEEKNQLEYYNVPIL